MNGSQSLQGYLQNPLLLLLFAFQVWMLIDAIRRQEWLWVLFIFLFPVLNAILYFFLVYRPQRAAASGAAFELPGAHNRKRIADLQAQIHHLDKPHHHAELGDIYLQQGKLKEAEKSYRAAIERDANDPDFQARLGECLLRQENLTEAAPLLESVVQKNPRHNYGHTLMAYADALAKLGHKELAVTAWKQVLEHQSYAHAHVQLAELYAELGQSELARKEITDFLADEKHAAAFQKKQDRVWAQRAKALQKKLS